MVIGMSLLYGAHFRQEIALEDTIEFHAFAPFEALLLACDRGHSSRVCTASYCCHCKLRPNAQGTLVLLLLPWLTVNSVTYTHTPLNGLQVCWNLLHDL